MRRIRLLTALALGLMLTLLSFGLLLPARAATFTVTKLTDSNDGLCGADCSLREAIVAANASDAPDTITLGAGVHVLSIAGVNEESCATGDLDVTEPLTITGLGAESTIIDARGIDRVLDLRSSAQTVVISGVTIQNGVLSGTLRDKGGGIHVQSGSHHLINTRIYSNRVTGASFDGGGGIYCNLAQLTLADSQVVSNVTNLLGGGLYVYGATSGVTTTGASQIAYNQASDGGGVYLDGGQLTIPAGQVAQNAASSRGGGMYLLEGTARLNGGSVVSNTAAQDGGGVRVGSRGIFTQTGTNSRIAANWADLNGGGLSVNTGGSVWLNGGQVVSNSANNGGGAEVDGNLTLQGAQVVSNHADSTGGGVWTNDSMARLTMLGPLSRVAHNTGQQGAGMAINYGVAEISGGLIWNNRATSYGGGLSVGAAQVTMSGGLVYSNSSDGNGGGLYVGNMGVVTQSGSSSLRQNRAGQGGGVYVAFGVFRMSGGSVISNSADTNGGGLLAYGNGGNAAVLLLDGGQILANVADRGGGIYVWLESASLTQTGASLIAFNRAEADGGGLYVTSGQVAMSGGRFFSNTAVISGGAIYNQAASQVSLVDGCIVGNSDTAVANRSALTLTATGNWWGDAAGPGEAGPGDGDTVSVKVDYSDWRSAPPAGCGGSGICLPLVIKD